MLGRTVRYHLPALHDAPPWSLAQLSRNTNNAVQYYGFLFRAWPLSSAAAELDFQLTASLASFLARVVRQLVGDHPGYLFVQYGSRLDRFCRVGVVPARHSRTTWLIAFGRLIASAPAFVIQGSTGSDLFACRFLTVPQNRSGCVEPELPEDCHRFRCSQLSFMQRAPAPSEVFPFPSEDDKDDAGLGDDGLSGELDDIRIADENMASDDSF
jgi:hypothetical protein